ncbi:phosphonate ABC transporter, permease protein PhnE [Humibacter soli]
MTTVEAAARATASAAPASSATPPRRKVSTQRIAGWIAIALMLAFGVYSLSQLGLNFDYFATAAQKVQTFFGTANNTISFPSLGDLFYLIGLTLGVVVLGTLVAALISVPVAYIAAANTAPTPWLRAVGRTIGVITRAIPDVVIAFSFALMFALGSTIPGVIAIGLHSIGMISKLFADAIEQIDEGPRQAIRAAGGSKSQQFWAGVIPQVMPSWIATTLHRFDINLRGSAILGYAGVGGLGYAMSLSFNQFNYGRGLGIALVIFLMCVLLEIVSSTIRRSLLGVQPSGKGIGDRIVRAATKKRGASTASTDAGAPLSSRRKGSDAGRIALTVEASMHRPWTRSRIRTWAWIVVTIAFIVLSAWWAQINPNQIMWNHVITGLEAFWPPSLGTAGPMTFVDGLFVTLQIAFAAATISLVLSFVIGSLAARNVAPNGIVRNTFRVILTILRGIPELIVALFLIVIVGLGAVPALIALAIGGIGLLGKLIADSFEEVPNGPETALSAAGATRGQRFLSATLPQGLPSLIGNSLYLVDTNIRAATLLGVVGAGGIGYYLAVAAGQVDQHNQVTTLVGILVVVVLIIEGIAAWLRRVFK